jgi:hypothetical protein
MALLAYCLYVAALGYHQWPSASSWRIGGISVAWRGGVGSMSKLVAHPSMKA